MNEDCCPKVLGGGVFCQILKAIAAVGFRIYKKKSPKLLVLPAFVYVCITCIESHRLKQARLSQCHMALHLMGIFPRWSNVCMIWCHVISLSCPPFKCSPIERGFYPFKFRRFGCHYNHPPILQEHWGSRLHTSDCDLHWSSFFIFIFLGNMTFNDLLRACLGNKIKIKNDKPIQRVLFLMKLDLYEAKETQSKAY